MVLQLPIYVVDHRFFLGIANCESAVSILPVEIKLNQLFLIDILAGIAFQLSYKVSYCLLCRYSHENVGVIVVTSNTKCMGLKIVHNTRHVVPYRLPNSIISKQGRSLLGAENKVIKKLLVGCHSTISPCRSLKVLRTKKNAFSVLP